MSTQPVPRPSAPSPYLVVTDTVRRRWARRLGHAIFALLLLFALALPFSVKGTQHVWRFAFFLWLIKLAIERRRPFAQPLALPMLVYIALSGISSALSPFAMASWDRMKIVCLVLIAILFAQNIRTLREMKWIVALLLFAAAVSAGITGWQYLGGYGVEITRVQPDTPMALAGIQSGDVIQAINGHGVHSPGALQQAVWNAGNQPLRVRVAHGTPIQRLDVTLSRASFLGAGLLFQNAPLRRGHPLRPQGYFSHYAIYAEVMLQLGLLAWGLLLARRRLRGPWRWLLAAVFLMTLAVVIATQTRSAIGAMLLGAFVLVMIATTWRERALGLGLLLVVVGFSTFWIHHTRGLNWIENRDPGTEYRVLMWQDALRLMPQHPLFGIGMESEKLLWRQYDIRAYRLFPVRWHFHSTYLQLAVERGLPALAAWLWLAGAYLVFLVKLLPRARDRGPRQARFWPAGVEDAGWLPYGIVLGVLGGFIAFLACGIVQYNLGEEQISAALWCFVGLTLALDRIRRGLPNTQTQLVSS
jgi:hypothetical protein